MQNMGAAGSASSSPGQPVAVQVPELGERLLHDPAGRRPPDPPLQQGRKAINRIFGKHCLVMGVLLAGSVVLLVLPMWLVYPPYGKAILLSWPPTVVCALSWMAGAWWGWDKDRWLLMSITLGAVPFRLAFMLGWVCLVIALPGTAVLAFVLALMWHWVIFAVPEFAMLVELSREAPAAPSPRSDRLVGGAVEHHEVTR